jgi:ubiquinone/menaquinone biosynthesis C-methylase UbiE
MADVQRSYVPAAGNDWSLPFYDPLVKLIGGDGARRVLIEQAALQPGFRVLEVGCGTGSLLMSIKRTQPGVDVTGLDPDPKALSRASRKADAARVAIRLDRGFSDELPYPDASFDRVFSCFMFHHLTDVLRDRHRLLPGRCAVMTPAGQRPRAVDVLERQAVACHNH